VTFGPVRPALPGRCWSRESSAGARLEEVVVSEHPRSGTDSGQPVTVGLDGSEYSDEAAAWAAREALRRGTALRLLTVADGADGSPGGAVPGDRAGVRPDGAYALQAQAEAWLAESFPGLEVTCDVVVGDPVHELRSAAQRAAILVVGTRGRGGFPGLALGSVSLRLAATAGCPLVVVPHGDVAPAYFGITVVGFTIRECSRVLRFALEHAGRIRGGLRVVHAWNPGRSGTSAEHADGAETETTARYAAQRAMEWLKAAHAETYVASPEISVLRGRSDEVLADQSRTADLLVLGAHRKALPPSGGVGTVLHEVLLNTRCPAALVPVY
jgi:nucleotide-binding universal stress UspA family protein